jgi:DNA-binding response OmpR family regulator
LTDEGYQTLCCRSQLEAYAQVVLDRPALLIADLHLEQRASGLRLAKQLRQNARTRDLPILICSADQAFLRERMDQLQQLGCTVLEKPFDLEDLLATVAAGLGGPFLVLS